MTRLLILVLIVVGVMWWLFGRKRSDRDASDRPAARPAAPPPAAPGKPAPVPRIVACAHCGVHLPSQETVVDEAGQVYCGEAHRLAGPR
jgi:uncharacterized protein